MSISTPAKPSFPTSWPLVFLFIATGMVAAFQIAKVAQGMPGLRAELGIGMFAAGFVASLYSGTSVVLGLPGGVLADRFGHRFTIMIGLAMIGIGSVLGSFAVSLPFLYATRIVEGIGFVLVVVSGPTLILQAASGSDRDRDLAVGIWGAFMPLGLTLMFVVAPLFLAPFGWRGLWLANAAIAFTAIVFVAALTQTNRARFTGWRQPAVPGKLLRDLRQVVATPAPWVFSLMFGLFGFQFATVLTWLPTFLIEVQGQSLAAAATLTALVAFFNAPGNLVGGWLISRGLPRAFVVAIGSLGMGVFALVLYFEATPLPIAVAAAIAFSLVAGLVPAAIFTAARIHVSNLDQVGVFNGVLLHFANLGVLLGAPILGAIVAAFDGWEGGGVFVLAVGIVSVPLAMVSQRIERRVLAARAAAGT